MQAKAGKGVQLAKTGCAFIGAWLLAGHCVADALPAAAAYAQVPDMETVRISPDGQLLAWIGLENGKPAVSVYDLDSKRFLKPIDAGERYRLRNLAWADNQTLLITLSFNETIDPLSIIPSREIYTRILAFDVNSSMGSFLLLNAERRQYVSNAELLRIHTGRPRSVVMSSPDFLYEGGCARGAAQLAFYPWPSFECWQHSLFEVDLRTGEGKVIDGGTSDTIKWIVTAEGQPAARIEWSRPKHGVRVSVPRNGGWRSLYHSDDYFALQPSALSSDGSALIAVGSRDGKRSGVWRMPIDGSEITQLHESDTDVESIVQDPYTAAPVGYRIGGLTEYVEWLDGKYRQVQAAAERAFPGRRVTIEDRSENFKRIVLRTDGTALAPAYYVVDFERGTADMIGEAYPVLTSATLAQRQPIEYKAGDGLMIPAYLTLPSGRDPGNLPLVVIAHDGPQGRDHADFDWRSQFLASRGYAVLQPQYRGTSGFGGEFERAGREHWGDAVQDDVADGVRYLIEQRIADPSRVCILGDGFGGYIAMAGAAHRPDLYRCAASINGVSDLHAMYDYLLQTRFDKTMPIAAWRDRIGNPYAVILETQSPVRTAERIRLPILLIHAKDDAVVPFRQSERFAQELEQQRKAYELIELKGEDHGLSSGESRTRVLEALEEFLATNLRPGAALPGRP